MAIGEAAALPSSGSAACRTRLLARAGINELGLQQGREKLPDVEVIDGTGRGDLVDEAAQVWAEATAARDGNGEVPGLEVSRPVIQEVLDRSAGALLLIARSADGTAAGFAVVEPLAGRDKPVVQVSYMGVRA